MNIEIKIRCAPIPQSRCVHVERMLNDKYGRHAKKNTGRFEHIVRTTVPTYTRAEELMEELRSDSKGEISIIEYDVLNSDTKY